MYRVKEIFYSIQGEGYYSGRPALFCRFSGCNLWSGKEEDRKTATCSFCDTDFLGTDGPEGGIYENAGRLSRSIAKLWPQSEGHRFVVCTGGEPLLQMDSALVDALHKEGFEIALETNGTICAPPGIDWICVSPKAHAKILQTFGHELKLVYPQTGAEPSQYEKLDFRHFFLQPMDGPGRDEALRQTLAYVLAHPRWRIGLQLHKILGVR
ncbi:MAG: 7-carboxy-7-deazaguanine synthase [Deltaproteobacteria bacterium]|nr:7-carboxy-7-deazaguanine synthase [Deltaproteobacteria bacterium]